MWVTVKTKICYYDIETSYIITREKKWGLYDERPIEREIVQDFQILTVAWQWEGQKKVHVMGQDDFKGYKPGKLDDYKLCKFIHEEIFSKADVLVAHNGDQFDQKKVRARMLINGFTLPAPPIEVDTKKMAKRIAGFTSNKLGDLARMLGVPHKEDPGGMSTWDGYIAGEPKAVKKMKWYNKHDIPPLRGVYMKLRAADKSHVPLNMIEGKMDACPVCLKTGKMQSRGYQVTKTNRYQRFQCQGCGAWLKSRTAEKGDKPLYV